MYLSDAISILLPPGHCLYEPVPGYILSITFGNARLEISHKGFVNEQLLTNNPDIANCLSMNISDSNGNDKSGRLPTFMYYF